MTTEQVTLRAQVSKLKNLLRQSALQGETSHDDVYLQVTEGEVRVLEATPGETILTYASFDFDWFDDVEVERDPHEIEYQDRAGNDQTRMVEAEAILTVDDVLEWMGHASDEGTLELTFQGDEDKRLAEWLDFSGAINTGVRLPGSEASLESVPQWLPSRFTEDDVYCDPNGNPAPVNIQTKSKEIQRIIDIVESDPDSKNYPIKVEDGSFFIDIGGKDGSHYAQGELTVQSISAPDDAEVENYYRDGFEEVFDVLSGAVSLQTGPGNGPVAIVQNSGNGRTIRHVNGSVNV